METQGILIYGGDLNIQLQPKLDSSNQRQKKSPNAIMVLWMHAGVDAGVTSFKLDLPSLGEQQNKETVAEITAEDMKKAISQLKANKAAGTDGYPSKWS